MVAGDLVNTASRVQSVAEPGSVFVGEATRRASERTIVYEDAGSFELKGRRETPLWRALRVVSGRARRAQSEGLEAPFVGRDRELRQIKDLFHTCAEERRAQLVSVTGIAGIGKSRLAWEFYKYFDGLSQTVYWHRGRCLSYGEGVTYWALADMVRMRCRIAEDDDRRRRRCEKLHATLEEHLLDAGGAPLRRATARAAARPRRAGDARPARPLRGLAALLRAAGRRVSDGARLRGHAVGRRVACSTSSSTCSNGRATIRCSWSRLRGRSCSSSAPPGAPATATSPRSTWSRCRSRRCRSFCSASYPGCRRAARPDPRPRGRRPALRGRDRAHAARPRSPRREGSAYRPWARSTRWRCPRRCTR